MRIVAIFAGDVFVSKRFKRLKCLRFKIECKEGFPLILDRILAICVLCDNWYFHHTAWYYLTYVYHEMSVQNQIIQKYHGQTHEPTLSVSKAFLFSSVCYAQLVRKFNKGSIHMLVILYAEIFIEHVLWHSNLLLMLFLLLYFVLLYFQE